MNKGSQNILGYSWWISCLSQPWKLRVWHGWYSSSTSRIGTSRRTTSLRRSSRMDGAAATRQHTMDNSSGVWIKMGTYQKSGYPPSASHFSAPFCLGCTHRIHRSPPIGVCVMRQDSHCSRHTVHGYRRTLGPDPVVVSHSKGKSGESMHIQRRMA